ncbi:DUF4136 domain-containing protein [Endozoicomonas sp. SCSIO W0465]|uniref:DUF4136 domain-containing protein n=1 Tax=Endozoicomonas sp. SCSIO W0465 TaxID=2918516 RepID=UPI002074D16B|nr:DUF4136 domain-containing protein [Endozoicomonas sp. SCSIO W0465]USE36086.1 DUF4136 domain-containing protein [Endozoicomonas sp. SCSIO W0465]
MLNSYHESTFPAWWEDVFCLLFAFFSNIRPRLEKKREEFLRLSGISGNIKTNVQSNYDCLMRFWTRTNQESEMRRYLIPFVLLTMFLAGCAAKPEVSWDYNPQIDWPAMTTWAWFQPERDNNNQIISLMAQRVHLQVLQDLATKGLQEVPAQQASMWLSWGFTEKSKLEGTAYNTFYNGGFYYGPWMMTNWPSQVVVNSYEVGHLTLNVIDPANNRVIWQGIASQRLTSDMSPEEQREYITKSVNSLLEKFPPPVNYIPQSTQ